MQLQVEDVKQYCLTFIKSNSALVASHDSFDALESCQDARLAVQVARIIAGGEKGGYSGAPPGLVRNQQKRKRERD